MPKRRCYTFPRMPGGRRRKREADRGNKEEEEEKVFVIILWEEEEEEEASEKLVNDERGADGKMRLWNETENERYEAKKTD